MTHTLFDPVSLVPYTGPTLTLNEIPQLLDIQYSWAYYDKAGGRLIQIMQFVKCRDFLHDVVSTQLHKGILYIYGLKFKYDESYGHPFEWVLLVKSDNSYIRNVMCPKLPPAYTHLLPKNIPLASTVRAYFIPEQVFYHPSALHYITFLFRVMCYKRVSAIEEVFKVMQAIATPDSEVLYRGSPEVVHKLLSNLNIFKGLELEVYGAPGGHSLHNSGIHTFMINYINKNKDSLGIKYLPEDEVI